MWIKEDFFKYTLGILVVLLIIYMGIQVSQYLSLFLYFLYSFIFPIIIALIFYYLLRPLRNFLEYRRIPRIASIAIIYLIVIGFFSLIITFIWPFVRTEIAEFQSLPEFSLKEELKNKTYDFFNLFDLSYESQARVRESFIYYFEQSLRWLTANFFSSIGLVTTTASYLIITPFIIYYLLKDDEKIYDVMVRNIPPSYDTEGTKILKEIDEGLSSYITGQFTVACIVGTLIFIGYKFIGLNYALLLAFIATVANLIPFAGPIVSTIPAVILAMQVGYIMVFKVLAVVSVVHFMDLNLISPRIVGRTLAIHPITVLLLLVASLATIGFMGMFLIIPVYVVIKIIFINLIQLQSKEKIVTEVVKEKEKDTKKT